MDDKLKFYKLNQKNIDGEELRKIMYEESMYTRKMFKQKLIPYKQYLVERFNDWSGYENE